MSDKFKDKSIVTEMETSFLDYAMSVIVARALPDARDGLKPVHRRILYAMNDLGNYADKPYKKSARIVGDVIGKYHPHGDTAVYEAMVRMAQDFSFREPLIDGHGNFGSIDGDGAAAMRYTEARMAKLSMELLRDIGKETIDYRDNYDATEREPVVLPAKFPNLLVNGSSGIAVGMATNIPPHNLNEVINGVLQLIDNPESTIEDIMEHIPGPDLPLGAQILGNHGITKAYTTGNGSVKVRSKYQVFEEKNGKSTIIINEIPYQVNKASLVEKIAEVVRDKRVEGITDLRDESDRDGIRIVIELKKSVTAEVVINSLFKYTQLENNIAINMLALVGGEPKVLNIKEVLVCYLEHQREVIRRKTEYELRKANERIHLLNGLKIAVDNIDRVLVLIRASETTQLASEKLQSEFDLSEIQAKAILEMRLQKLTGLEIEKLEAEINELLITIDELKSILDNKEKLDGIIREELEDIKERFGNERRTEIIEGYIDSSIDYEELIEEEDNLVLLTTNGYIKRMSPDEYRTQNRGGKGSKGMSVNAEDILHSIIQGSTHSDLMFFTNTGRVYTIRTHRVPLAKRTGKGIPVVNLIDLDKDEKVTNLLIVKDYGNESLFFATKKGYTKKTKIIEYQKVNKNGKIAINLKDGDEIVKVFSMEDDEQILLASEQGKAILTSGNDYRPLSRNAGGVRGIKLAEDDIVIDAYSCQKDSAVLTLTKGGFGKISDIDKYNIQSRGGKGAKNINISEVTGTVAAIKLITPEEYETSDLILITNQGQSIRLNLSGIKKSGRATRGVRVFRLSEDDQVSVAEVVDESGGTNEE